MLVRYCLQPTWGFECGISSSLMSTTVSDSSSSEVRFVFFRSQILVVQGYKEFMKGFGAVYDLCPAFFGCDLEIQLAFSLETIYHALRVQKLLKPGLKRNCRSKPMELVNGSYLSHQLKKDCGVASAHDLDPSRDAGTRDDLNKVYPCWESSDSRNKCWRWMRRRHTQVRRNRR